MLPSLELLGRVIFTPFATGPFKEFGGVAPEVTISMTSSYVGESNREFITPIASSNFLIPSVRESPSLTTLLPRPVPTWVTDTAKGAPTVPLEAAVVTPAELFVTVTVLDPATAVKSLNGVELRAAASLLATALTLS